ncbi:FMN-binding negative transcriptional regulator [Thioclava sp. BHET1]|nr:FMN-binding negative transcriptional regulator [Thioclava sp. BHET1]
MHPNPVYRQTGQAENLAFARVQGFGTLCVTAEAGPLLSHIPFLLSEDGQRVEFHLVRSNPILRAGPGPAVLAVTGPHGYISPDWYGLEDQVPTWNYVAVHLRGRIEQRPDAELPDLLDRLSARFEADLAPKTPWTSAKMTPGVMDRLMRMIVPFQLQIESVEGTWKLTQNKVAEARLGAATGLEAAAADPLATQLAALMRGVGA